MSQVPFGPSSYVLVAFGCEKVRVANTLLNKKVKVKIKNLRIDFKCVLVICVADLDPKIAIFLFFIEGNPCCGSELKNSDPDLNR